MRIFHLMTFKGAFKVFVLLILRSYLFNYFFVFLSVVFFLFSSYR